MKKSNTSTALLIASGVMGLFLLTGCCNQCREKVVTYDVTKSGDNWTESQTIQKRQGPRGRVEVDKQTVYNEVSCVRNGVKIPAKSQEQCIKSGGNIVENVIVDEESRVSR